MTLERLGQLVASYGANPQRWPEDERQAGMQLMADPKAADIALQAGTLDRLLAGLPAPQPANTALQERLEAISMLPQDGDARPAALGKKEKGGHSILAALFGALINALAGTGTFRGLIPQAAGLVMICLAGGVALGLSDFAAPPERVLVVDPSAYFFGDPGLDSDLEELD